MHREGAEALAESGVVLLGQDGGRHQQADLHTLVDGLKGGAQGYFGFAVAHIAANQPIHRAGLFHIELYFIDGLHLVGSFLIGKGILQFLLPNGIAAELMPLGGLAGGVEFQQFLGQFPGRGFDPFFEAGPFGGAEAG